jgi:hypothetical protein
MSRININARCSVKLTEYGVSVLTAYFLTLECKPPLLGIGNEYVTQLWDLFQVFGPEMYMGNRQIFENNEVIFQ